MCRVTQAGLRLHKAYTAPQKPQYARIRMEGAPVKCGLHWLDRHFSWWSSLHTMVMGSCGKFRFGVTLSMLLIYIRLPVDLFWAVKHVCQQTCRNIIGGIYLIKMVRSIPEFFLPIVHSDRQFIAFHPCGTITIVRAHSKWVQNTLETSENYETWR